MRASLFAGLLLLAPFVHAAEITPPASSYGFDWLKPNSTRCAVLQPKLSSRFKSCQREENPFGLTMKAWVCRVNDRSEYFFFATWAQCQEAFETMQANAP
ncbi:hypothetical protein [Uliginosibacterium flavum]|uniref:DUF3012 domain-containing protein n=1 Tax=Uliginosibacterium flavum TaxID=1396831 RepID=A0ABV2TM94_9RHOO